MCVISTSLQRHIMSAAHVKMTHATETNVNVAN